MGQTHSYNARSKLSTKLIAHRGACIDDPRFVWRTVGNSLNSRLILSCIIEKNVVYGVECTVKVLFNEPPSLIQEGNNES